MKKILLPIIGIAFTSFAFGQNITPIQNTKKALNVDSYTLTTTLHSAITPSRGSGGNSTATIGTVWFTETFGSGLLGDGTNGAWTTNGTVSNSAGVPSPDPDAVWEYRGTTTTPNNTIGSRGQWSGTQTPIASPTASNGFFIFDSDYLETNGIGPGNGTALTPHKSWLISPSFSTIGSNNIQLSLSTYFRRFQGTCYVLLSTDNGVTWGDSVEIIGPTYPVNGESDTDVVILESIPFLENNATAKIALFFDGETESNSFGSGYYFAMIDDILIVDAPDNDLIIGDNYYQTGYDTGTSAYYSSVPVYFTSYDSIQFSGWVENNGAVLQENVVFQNTITFNGGTPTVLASVQGINLINGASDSLATTSFYLLDQGIGEYSFLYSVASDSTDDIPANNFKGPVSINVTDTTYARDAGASGNFWYGAGSTFEIGNIFEIYDSVNVTSVSVAVGTNSNSGSAISVYVYNLTNLTTPVTKKEFIILNSSTIGTLVSYDVPDSILSPGKYVVTYKTYTDDVYFTVSNYEAKNGMSVANVDAGGWGWTSNVPEVRLNISSINTVCSAAISTTQLSNDSVKVTLTRGVAPLTYIWSTGDITTQIGGVQNCANYSVTVTDSLSCSYTDSITFIYHDTIDYDVCQGTSFTYADGTVNAYVNTDISYTSTIIGGSIGGCDSIVTQNLTALPASITSRNYTICFGDSFTFIDGTQVQNITSYTSHSSIFTGASPNGCDSTIIENITVIPVAQATLNHDVCYGEKFVFYDGTVINNVTSPISYTSIISGGAVSGCDSSILENLAVINIDVSVTVNGKSLMANLVGASYQWLDCKNGSMINGATNRIFTPTINGLYQVEVTDTACTDTSICFSVIIDGISEHEQDLGITIYPNPIIDQLKIDKGRNKVLMISIINYTGKQIYELKTSNQEIIIDFKSFPSGVYLVKVDNGAQTMVKKLIKE